MDPAATNEDGSLAKAHLTWMVGTSKTQQPPSPLFVLDWPSNRNGGKGIEKEKKRNEKKEKEGNPHTVVAIDSFVDSMAFPAPCFVSLFLHRKQNNG